MDDITPQIDRLIDAALAEDIGLGDATTSALVSGDRTGSAYVVSREPLVVAGLRVFERVFHRLDRGVEVGFRVADGARCATADRLADVSGRLASILTGERVALNFLQRLSGIATSTRACVDAIPEGCATAIVDTRKTTPGLRLLERYAVRCGGGVNHRPRLDGGVLIKDNHIALCGSVSAAVRRARAAMGPAHRIEVEVGTLDQLDEALASGAEVIMLDNMSLEDSREAVRRVRGRALVEASGGITRDAVRALAEAGVDFISVGALTHSARAIDLSLEIGQC
jgi:nicotinate-nucleotide pyrophosphorylase (carboxylating)